MADSPLALDSEARFLRQLLDENRVFKGPMIVPELLDRSTFVAFGRSHRSIDDAQDVYFPIHLEEGATYIIEAHGSYHPEMGLYDWDGYFQSSVDIDDDYSFIFRDDYGEDTISDYVADYTGTHWVRVLWEYLDNASGTVEVRVFQKTETTPVMDVDDIRKATAEDAAIVGRLYQAALGREPDESGLSWWIDQWEKGVETQEMAARFYDSAEFKTNFGENLSDSDFMQQIYSNILGRDPDPIGLNFYTDELSAGTKTREQIIAEFSESEENLIITAGRFEDLHYSGANEWFMDFS